jgi:CubicO group peptidase (beta-lactamase class C family)
MVLTFPPRARSPQSVDPREFGFDPDRLQDAVDHAKLHETPSDQIAYDYSNKDPWAGDPDEYAGALGPFPDRRGGQNGIVVRDGTVVAEWGDTTRVDHCFSVAKSFLSVLGGVAYDRGLIEDVTDPVAEYVDDGGFDSEHNRAITWEQFLQGTSEWEGTLFDKPDTVDRNRPVGRDESSVDQRGARELREPGSYWEYNDVRINRLALSLLRLWAKPLPRVLAHEVMDPIGATRTWEWYGYYNSDVDVEDRTMKSVSGGGHWGGGLWMSTRDLARFGQLLLNGGQWGDERIVSEEWLDRAATPCAVEEGYGYLFWLNTDRELWPTAPESAFAARGHGANVVWVDPEHDLVAVLRWLDSGDGTGGFFRRLMDALV